MKVLLPTFAFVLLVAGSASAQFKSVYTSTKTSSCRTIESSTEETGSYIGECRGVGGYKIQLLEGDIRQTLNIITPGKKKFELEFWRLYSSF